MTIALFLIILAAVFAVLSLFSVPSKVSWNAVAVLCLCAALTIAR